MPTELCDFEIKMNDQESGCTVLRKDENEDGEEEHHKTRGLRRELQLRVTGEAQSDDGHKRTYDDMNNQLKEFNNETDGMQPAAVSRKKRKCMKGLKVYSKKPEKETNDQSTNFVSRKFISDMRKKSRKTKERVQEQGF